MVRLLPAFQGKAGKPDAGSPPPCQEAWTGPSPSKMRASSVVTDCDVSDLGLTSEDLKSVQLGKLPVQTTGWLEARRASEPIHGDGAQSWHLGLAPLRPRRPSASSSPRKRPSLLPLAPATGGNSENSANNASDSEDYQLPPNVKSARGRPTEFSGTQSWQLGQEKSEAHRTRLHKSMGPRRVRTQSQELVSPVSTKASTPRQEVKAEASPLPLLDQRPPPMAMAPRCFSFAEDSMADVMANILDEEPECGWMEEFWLPVLEGSPPEICVSISGRSISHWIELFNRWQAAGGWNPGSAPRFMDAYAFRDFIAAPMTKALKWVKVFDPPAFSQLEATKSKMAYQNVKISPAAFLTSSILIATKIAKKQKIRFILGVFDEDDSETFDRNEFVEMISSFLLGLGTIFGSSVPKPSRRQWIGKLLFDRIQMMACCKLPALEAATLKSSDSMPFSLLEEWFLGESGDPFAVPFALLLERFSLPGFNEDPEKFEDEDTRFKITHRRRVAPPVETESSLDMSFIKRHQIEPLRRMFDFCQKDSYYSISHGEAERALETSIHPDLWCSFAARGLEQLESMPQSRKSVAFLTFLKKAMPHAQPRHHRMFSSWLQELDEIEQLKKQVATSRSEQQRFQNYISRWPLHAVRRRKLQEQFEMLGEKALVHGDVEEEEVVVQDPILERLQSADKMTKDDYVAAKCGVEQRPNESKPQLDQVVGDFLRHQVRQLEETLAQLESLFASGNGVTGRPSFIKPAVTQRQWSLWNEAFDMMTPTCANTGRVNLKEFAFQHDICPATCVYLCQSIGHGTEMHDLGFTKDEFLQKMLDTFRHRVRKEFLVQGRLCKM
ncbi:unnamed protein product [Symbiodinium sp. CCMP2592]|nr:unnamed protein product [Symbiodinium sp. CCMP2592]